jgi:hypothetical protein
MACSPSPSTSRCFGVRSTRGSTKRRNTSEIAATPFGRESLEVARSLPVAHSIRLAGVVAGDSGAAAGESVDVGCCPAKKEASAVLESTRAYIDRLESLRPRPV